MAHNKKVNVIYRELHEKTKAVAIKRLLIFFIIILIVNFILIVMRIPMITVGINNGFILLVFLIWENLKRSYVSEDKYEEFVVFFKELNAKIVSKSTFKESLHKIHSKDFKLIGDVVEYVQSLTNYQTNYELMDTFFEIVANDKINRYKYPILERIKNHDYDFKQIVKSIDNEDKLERLIFVTFKETRLVLYLITLMIALFSGLGAYISGYQFLVDSQFFIHIYLLITILTIVIFQLKPISQRYLFDAFVLYALILFLLDILFFFARNFQQGIF